MATKTSRTRSSRTRTPKHDDANAPMTASADDHAFTAADAPVEPSQDAPLFIADMTVRWRDLDAFNHVNNSTYLTYLEEARLQWLRHVPGPWFDEHAMPVMAASELNYRRPIAWPARLHIQLYLARLGGKSLSVAHRIVDADDATQLYCDGQVTMVWVDPAAGTSVPLPDAIRDAVSGEH